MVRAAAYEDVDAFVATCKNLGYSGDLVQQLPKMVACKNLWRSGTCKESVPSDGVLV